MRLHGYLRGKHFSYDDTRRSCGGYNLLQEERHLLQSKVGTERDIPTWKFYDGKSRYALEQESSEAKGESCKKQVFLQQQFSEKLISAAFRKDCSVFLIVFCFKSNKGKDAVIVRITRLLLGNRHAHEKGWSESHIKQEALEKPDR